MTRARTGLETDPLRVDQRDFWKNMHALERIRRSHSEAEAHAQVVKYLAEYCGLEGATAEIDVETEYSRFRSRITAADRALDRYTHDLVPEDLLQRLSLTHEIAGASDPDQLIDMLLTVKDQRTRFEIRRLLHLGALFYEFEKLFGREADMNEYLHQLEMYLDATLFSEGEMVDADLYHKVKDDGSGLVIASSIRLPKFDGSATQRQRGENHVQLSFRTVAGTSIQVVTQERLKDPFSAALKAIRKRLPLAKLKDIYGFALYVNQGRDARDLQQVVEQLERHFVINPTDRAVHPLRRAEGIVPTAAPNRDSGQAFDIEKFFADWDPAIVKEHAADVQQILGRYYSTGRNQQRFWEHVDRFSGQRQRVEFQVGTLRDLLTARLSGGDENHRVYKYRQASRAMTDDARNILELLYPPQLYGIRFSDAAIVEAMRRKQLAGIGLHAAVLAQLDASS